MDKQGPLEKIAKAYYQTQFRKEEMKQVNNNVQNSHNADNERILLNTLDKLETTLHYLLKPVKDVQGLLLNDKLDSSIISPSMKTLCKLNDLKNDIVAMVPNDAGIQKSILEELNFK